ncbi:MAG: helix-turn-helix domain-containing protein [Solirubrobacterales bacterium]|nr:helix-turn-helix domain-containing protein [Solirubrobacterales bacterium]
MDASWDDEYLTVQEIADRLKLNQQTIRNWIDEEKLPAVRIGRRVRVRRVDLDAMLAQGATVEVEPQASTVAPGEAVEQLTEALDRAGRLLDRLSGARRAELIEGLQQLTEAVAAAVQALSDDSVPTAAETE